MLKVIFACVHNAGRSQMAAAFFNQLAGPEKAQAISAGTEPGERVHLEVLAAMNEIGIDLSTQNPRSLRKNWRRMHSSSSQWGVVTGALIFLACGGTIGPSAIQKDSRWMRFGQYATTSNAGWRIL
jgi:hypothetical protein